MRFEMAKKISRVKEILLLISAESVFVDCVTLEAWLRLKFLHNRHFHIARFAFLIETRFKFTSCEMRSRSGF